MGFRAEGLGLKVLLSKGLGFSGFRVLCMGFRVQAMGFRGGVVLSLKL